jgi:hypothetical protein
MVDRAVVIADCPAFRKTWDKGLHPDDYEGFDWSGLITVPLWGVGLLADAQSNCGIEGTDGETTPPVAGGFVSKAEEDNDGMLLVSMAPSWLQWLRVSGDTADATTAIEKEEASRTTTSDVDPPTIDGKPDPEKAALGACDLLKRAAQDIYIQNMLRGRSAMISGKLRFDISPGSIVKIESKPELFEDGVDELAVAMYGQVNRVTININAEARLAGTTFNVSHVRTEKENSLDRTSAAAHPIFGEEIFVGAPLLDDDWAFHEE